MKTIKNTANLPEIRCPECGKLLAKGRGLIISVKCPRCKTLNTFSDSRGAAKPEHSAIAT